MSRSRSSHRRGVAAPVTSVLCRCREITEEEVLAAIRDGARSVRGVKLRTHAGMGLCQGQTCGPLIEAILRRELGVRFRPDDRLARAPTRPVALRTLAHGHCDATPSEPGHLS
jgi:NAD(P)H-nitrite reductase large subunit